MDSVYPAGCGIWMSENARFSLDFLLIVLLESAYKLSPTRKWISWLQSFTVHSTYDHHLYLFIGTSFTHPPPLLHCQQKASSQVVMEAFAKLNDSFFSFSSVLRLNDLIYMLFLLQKTRHPTRPAPHLFYRLNQPPNLCPLQSRKYPWSWSRKTTASATRALPSTRPYPSPFARPW